MLFKEWFSGNLNVLIDCCLDLKTSQHSLVVISGYNVTYLYTGFVLVLEASQRCKQPVYPLSIYLAYF